MKIGLETTEYIVGFGNVVETIGKNTFQKFDDIGCEADGTEICYFARRFPSFEQWNDSGNPLDSLAISK